MLYNQRHVQNFTSYVAVSFLLISSKRLAFRKCFDLLHEISKKDIFALFPVVSHEVWLFISPKSLINYFSLKQFRFSIRGTNIIHTIFTLKIRLQSQFHTISVQTCVLMKEEMPYVS